MRLPIRRAPLRYLSAVSAIAVSLLGVSPVFAQSADPSEPETAPALPSPEPEPTPPPPDFDPLPPASPAPVEPAPVVVEPPQELPPPRMSEGRLLVSLYNSGFQFNLSPGVVFVDGKAGFYLGVRFGYGWDIGPIILVPGIRLAGYFTDPNVYIGMPIMKIVIPADRFAPFIQGGAGIGNVAADGPNKAKTGASLLAGGGFMIHFSPAFALGAEFSYEVITGTNFKGIGFGPIIAFGF